MRLHRAKIDFILSAFSFKFVLICLLSSNLISFKVYTKITWKIINLINFISRARLVKREKIRRKHFLWSEIEKKNFVDLLFGSKLFCFCYSTERWMVINRRAIVISVKMKLCKLIIFLWYQQRLRALSVSYVFLSLSFSAMKENVET